MSVAACGCPILTSGYVNHDVTCWLSPLNALAPTRAPHRCPVCGGHGTVSRPPWVAGDQTEWASNGTETYPCRACRGTGIVWEGEAR